MDDPLLIRWIVQAIIILVLSICVHEFGHAIVAHWLGDGLPKSQGRVTLNPAAHADPIGTLAFPLIGLIVTKGATAGFGWGKPVMVNPVAFSRRWRMRTGHMMVALAGPAMNILLGLIITTIHLILLKTGVISIEHDTRMFPTTLHGALAWAAFLNFILAFFNLIPAPPLDGGAVLEGFLPDKWVPTYQNYAPYGPFVLMAVIFIPGMHRLFTVPAQFLLTQWAGIIGLDLPHWM